MIRRATFFGFVFLALFIGGVIFETFYSSKGGETIEEILTSHHSTPKNEEKYPSKQMRSHVSKDLWITDEEKGRLHHRIECPRSILTAIPAGNKTELVEQMIEMQCFFQEKIEKTEEGTFQHIRFLQSNEGTYHYSSHLFDANAVFLALYEMPGETLVKTLDPKTAFMQGVAGNVTLSLSEGAPNFHAEKFKAHIRPQQEAP